MQFVLVSGTEHTVSPEKAEPQRMRCTTDCVRAYNQYESSLHKRRTEKKAQKSILCNKCGRTFRYRQEREWHEQNHHLMIHFCYKMDCKKAFQSVRGLELHIGIAHHTRTAKVSSEKTTQADICTREPIIPSPSSDNANPIPQPLFTIPNVNTLQSQSHPPLNSEDETASRGRDNVLEWMERTQKMQPTNVSERPESSISSLVPASSVTSLHRLTMSPETPMTATPVTVSAETSTTGERESSSNFQQMTERLLTGLNYRECDRNRLTNLIMTLGRSLGIFNRPDIKYDILEAINSDTVPTLQENDLYHFQMVEDLLTKQGQSSRKTQIELLKKIFSALTSVGIPDLKIKFLEAVHKFARDTVNSNSGFSKIVPVVIEDDA